MNGGKMDLSQTSSQTPSQIQAQHQTLAQTQNQIQNQSHNLPIFSFLIRRGHRFLHHNFVCALLNDLFGVQSRGTEHQTVSAALHTSHTPYIFPFLFFYVFAFYNFFILPFYLILFVHTIVRAGGCQCAGPFSQHILGLSAESNKRIELALLDKHEVLAIPFLLSSLFFYPFSHFLSAFYLQ